MTGNIVKIQRLSTQDGPGIRTTVFMKGCNLNCEWCHNPETIDAASSIAWLEDLCTHCGNCVAACPEKAVGPGRIYVDSNRCKLCGKCVGLCPFNALEMIGEHINAEEVFRTIQRDKRYYDNSGGGVTVSGGEPMLQCDFVHELFLRCKENDIHTALDTAGNVRQVLFQSMLPVTDLFLYDLKIFDDALHRKYTGAGNKQIKSNLLYLLENGADVEIRIPVVCGVNDNEENMKNINQILKNYAGIKKIKLLPYHALGINKRIFANKKQSAKIFNSPDKNCLSSLAECFGDKVEY